ncbi:DUF58 domain-containing protein [Sutcliffiella cohnii]
MKAYFRKFKRPSKLIAFLFLLVVTFMYAMFQGGFVSWFLFFSFLPFSVYGLLVLFYPLNDFKVTRTLNQEQYRSGDRLIGTVTVTRKFPFPLGYLVMEEVLPSDLLFCVQTKKTKILLFPWFKKTITFQYALDRMPRGEHTLSTIRLKTGDFLGLLEKEKVFHLENHFLVYPHYVDLIYRKRESKFDQGSTTSNVKLVRDTSMTVGVREYQPGDRFSWIDWKATAKKNDIMTKEFEQQQSHDVLIYLDRSQAASFESAVSYTAALTKAILRFGSQVGLVSIGKDRSIFPLRGGEEQFAQIYFHLARVQPNSKISFAKTMEMEMGKAQPNVTFLFVTGKLTKGMVDSLGKLTYRQMNMQVYVTKDEGQRVSKEESVYIEQLQKRDVYVKVVKQGELKSLYSEVS